MRVAVIGAGAWGTALALVANRNGQEVVLWGHDREQLRRVKAERRNERYLPGVELPGSFDYEEEIRNAVNGAGLVLMAVPSKALREVMSELGPVLNQPVITVTKGIEYETGLTMSAVIHELAPGVPVAALSGPTFAAEVARGIPTASVIASENQELAEQLQSIFHAPAFRVYTSNDLLGVELGGALKNVIAIAAGVGDGLGFGDNTKAALITRALAEMKRLGTACGAQAETFAGLSGLGDLVATCFSKLSRNRGFGERIGRGEKPAAILAEMTSVAEGFPTARSAWRLAREKGVTVPVIGEIYAMLHEGKNPAQAVRDLTSRTTRAEIDPD